MSMKTLFSIKISLKDAAYLTYTVSVRHCSKYFTTINSLQLIHNIPER